MDTQMEVELAAADSTGDTKLKNLIAECTCPVCKGLIERPQRLPCHHSFCHRCLQRLQRKSVGESSLRCPVCREKFALTQPAQADPVTEALVSTLHQVKSNLCQEPNCWQKPVTSCPCCTTKRCRKHHDTRMAEMRAACAKVCKSAEAFVTHSSAEEKLISLKTAEDSLHSLHQNLTAQLEARMQECKQQLEYHKKSLKEQQVKCKPVLAELQSKLDELKQLQATDDYAAMRQAESQLRQLLTSAKRCHPPAELAPPAGSQADCLRGLAGVLARVRVDPVVRPYSPGEAAASLVRAVRTRPLQPWDLALLTNLSGVALRAGALVLDDSQPLEPVGFDCLVLVNFKGFTSKRLHAFDCDTVAEVATIALDMKSGEMPGKIAVCNVRQLIVASEPSQHCVFAFNLAGGLVKRFGRRGSEAGCFNEPMSLFPCEDTLYVVDSENKRVQLFNMAADFAQTGALEHPSFTGHVHSVHVGAEVVVVSDRQRKRLFAFDRATRQHLLEVGLPGQPFDMTCDQFGNVFVSLADTREVRVFNHSLTALLYVIKIPKTGRGNAAVLAAPDDAHRDGNDGGGRGGGGDSSSSSDGEGSEEPLRRLLGAAAAAAGHSSSRSGGKPSLVHGLVFAPERARLFVADTFRCTLLAYDLA